jgi:ABC-2 type transport system permease protein
VKRTGAVLRKEFYHILRDARALYIIFILPVVMLFLFGYAVANDVKHIPTALLDQDESVASFHLAEAFSRSGYFDLTWKAIDARQVEQLMDSSAVRCALVIPPGFAAKQARQLNSEVQILIDGTNPTTAQTALFSAESIVANSNSELTASMLQRKGQQLAFIPISLQSRVWYNPSLESLNFNIPGLIGIVLQFITINLTAFSIVREREKGTMEALIVTPLRPLELMLGKILPYIVLALSISLLVLAIAVLWFQVPFNGSFWLLLFLSFLFLASCLGIGLFISTMAENQFQAQQFSTFVVLPSIILSGFIFPIEAMPPVVQWVAWCLPLTHFLPILRGVILKGIGIEILWPETIWLLVFTILVLLVAALRFRKRLA